MGTVLPSGERFAAGLIGQFDAHACASTGASPVVGAVCPTSYRVDLFGKLSLSNMVTSDA